ncbi:MAG: MBL fold metallo-hydrolase [Halorientalis sp.]
MGIGDIHQVKADTCGHIYYVDVGMYGVAEYSSVYIIDDDRPTVVETGLGTRTELILDALAELGIDPADLEVIALTHVHLDHAGGVGALAEACPNATVAVHERGVPHLIDPTAIVAGTKEVVGEFWDYYTEPTPVPEDRLRALRDGDVLDLGATELHVHHAPGHASHQVLYEVPAADAVFTADAVGSYFPALGGVKAVSSPPEFDLAQCLADVDLVRSLDPSTLLFSHFGSRPTGEILEEYDAVLRAWIAKIARQRQQLDDDRAVFERLLDASVTPPNWPEDIVYGEFRTNFSGATMYLDQYDNFPAILH